MRAVWRRSMPLQVPNNNRVSKRFWGIFCKVDTEIFFFASRWGEGSRVIERDGERERLSWDAARSW